VTADSAQIDPDSLIEVGELRRSLVAGYAAAAITILVAAAVIRTDRNVGLLATAGVQACMAAFLAFSRSLPVWVIKRSAFEVAVIVIGAGVAFANPLGPVPLYYIWPALTCGQYGNRTDARSMMLLFAITFALALGIAHDPQVPGIMYVSVVSIVGLVLALHQRGHARRRELTRQLAHAAATDGLTGLLNRRAFNGAFAREVNRALSASLPLSLVVFDLDRFKEVNDRHGHSAGDDVLCAFASILSDECSDGDVVARVGGEEFAVVLFDTGIEEAQRVVDKIAVALRTWSLRSPIDVTTSAGIASLGSDMSSPVEMLVAADRALYAAKDAGRNRVVQFGDRAGRELPRAA
jgi:diguanylate cyclase (GGDEF)-like protein